MPIVTDPVSLPQLKLSIENTALMSAVTPCPAGQRVAEFVVPWHDWSATGKTPKFAHLTNGTNTYPAYLGRRVAKYSRLCIVDLPATNSGLYNSGSPASSVRGTRLTDYRIEQVDEMSWVGRKFTTTPTWNDVIGSGGGLLARIVGASSAVPFTATRVYADEYEAVFWVEAEQTVALNGAATKFLFEGYVNVTAPNKVAQLIHPRVDFSIQCVWSDRTDPRGVCADFSEDPFPGWSLEFQGTTEPHANYANGLNITETATTLTIPALGEMVDGVAMPIFGSFLRTDLSDTDDETCYEHFVEMPPSLICHPETWEKHFDMFYQVRPKRPESVTDSFVQAKYFEWYARHVARRCKEGADYDERIDGYYSNKNPKDAGGQPDFGVNKAGTLFYLDGGNTSWLNGAMMGAVKEFLRPRDFRTVNGQPLSWIDFPEGNVTDANKALINNWDAKGKPPIIYLQEMSKWYLGDGQAIYYNTLGKQSRPTPDCLGWEGYYWTHQSQNSIITAYKLTGNLLLQRKIRAVVEAYLFTNHVKGGYEYNNGLQSYISDPSEVRTGRVEQVGVACLECLHNSEGFVYPTNRFNHADPNTTDALLRDAVLDRIERIEEPDQTKGDFDRYYWCRYWIEGQRDKGRDAFVGVWASSAEIRQPLLYTAIPTWESMLIACGMHNATEFLRYYAPSSTALKKWEERRFWVLHTLLRWGMAYKRHERLAYDLDPTLSLQAEPSWWNIRYMKVPTSVPNRSISSDKLLTKDTDSSGVYVGYNLNLKSRLDLYVSKPWPTIRYHNDGPKAYSDLHDAKNGCRVCYVGHDNQKWTCKSDPIDPTSIYCDSFSSQNEWFFDWLVAAAKLQVEYAQAVLLEPGSTASEIDAANFALEVGDDVIAFVRQSEADASPLHSDYVAAVSGSFTDWSWPTAYEPGENQDREYRVEAGAASVESDGIGLAVDLTAEITVDTEYVSLYGPETQVSEFDVSTPTVIPASAEPTVSVETSKLMLYLDGATVWERTDDSEATLENTTSTSLLGMGSVQVVADRAKGLTVRYPQRFSDEADVVVQATGPMGVLPRPNAANVMMEAGKLYLGMMQELGITAQAEPLQYKLDNKIPKPNFNSSVGLNSGSELDGITTGSRHKDRQDFTLYREDSTVLAYKVFWELPQSLDTAEVTWWLYKNPEDTIPIVTKSSRYQSQVVRYAEDDIVYVVLDSVDTASIAFKDGETKQLYYHELEIKSSNSVFTTKGRMLLLRDSI